MTYTSVDSKYELNYFKIQDPGNAVRIKPHQTELEKSRTGYIKAVVGSVNEVRNDLENLKFEVFNNSQIQSMDNLKKRMFTMEEKISDLKETIKEEFLTLLRHEISLSKDVQFMGRRIEEWAKPPDAHIFKPVKHSNYKIRKPNVENPVVEFRNFLSNSGGHYGGWEEQDHLLFLKERIKYKKKEKFFSALHCLLPDISYEMIEEHDVWFQKYESLKSSQKEEIQKWKTEKQNQKKEEMDKEDEKQEKTELKKTVRRRINIAERIKQWKLRPPLKVKERRKPFLPEKRKVLERSKKQNQQVLKKSEEEERMKKEKERLKEEEKRKLEMQEMKKLAVMQYKAEKLKKLQEVLPKEEKKLLAQEAKAKNKVLLKAFRLQDLKFTEKKKIIRLQIESKSSDKFEKLRLTKPALEFILQRDPQRIFQPTLIWSQHCLETQKREKIDPVFDLDSIPRLAVPEWRRELK